MQTWSRWKAQLRSLGSRKHFWRIWAVGALLCVLCATPAAAQDLVGRVVGITDGDTLTVIVPGPHKVKVRLVEIDAPEKGQPWGARSKQTLSRLAFDCDVRVATRGTDRYGRTLGRVYCRGKDVNAEMVRTGSAWAYREYLTDRRILTLEARAKAKRIGLWSLPPDQVTPPWLWRRGDRLASRQPPRSPPEPRGSTPNVECGTKRYCRQMDSCAEARGYLSLCGVSSLDGDHDGTPCEAICRPR